MSSRNIIAALLLPLGLAACGFQPIAAVPEGVGEQDVVIADLSVNAEDRRFAYRLRKEILRFAAIDPAAPQSLRLTTTVKVEGLAIQPNDTITRRNITADTRYVLTEPPAPGETEPKQLKGRATAITAVNATSSQFSTNVSEREAMERLAIETAQRVVTFLRLNRPKADGGQGS